MKIYSKVKDYELKIVKNVLINKKDVLDGGAYDKEFFFIDKNVYLLYKNEIDSFVGDGKILVIEAIEQNKEYLKLIDYFSWLIDNQFTRKDVLITIGGGILQDISGFIASTLYRGLKWVFFPTTLLSQADSCIGSKTSINFGDSKNLIGSFYPPDNIFIDPYFCNTLTDEYFFSGIGEIIKFHLLSDLGGYERLTNFIFSNGIRNEKYLTEIILSTLDIKRSYFETDEFDTGRRNLLNYGHCFGHALESASNFEVSHGQAVLVGMSFADMLSLKRGILSEKLYDDFSKLYFPYFPEFNMDKISVEDILKYLKKDKKRVGKDLTMVIAENIGKFQKCDDIKEMEVREVYSDFKKKYRDIFKKGSI